MLEIKFLVSFLMEMCVSPVSSSLALHDEDPKRQQGWMRRERKESV